jgi:mRNA-degrading endonuclease RelE of RelBE toxin-antitoxin system
LPQTDALQGFGERRLFKTRVVNTSIQRGKSAGYRLVYEIVVEEDDDGFLLLLLYDHKTLRTEEEVRKELRTRLES